MKNIVENPFLGAEWSPIAEALLALHQARLSNIVTFHAYSPKYPSVGDKRGPTIKVTYLSNGDTVLVATANTGLASSLPIEKYEAMEFMDFLVPKDDEGQIAINPDDASEDSNSRFVRVFRDGEEAETLVELSLQLMAIIYGIESNSMFFFGTRDGQQEFVHGLDKLERYAVDSSNTKGAIFGLKGSHPYKLLFGQTEDQNRREDSFYD